MFISYKWPMSFIFKTLDIYIYYPIYSALIGLLAYIIVTTIKEKDSRKMDIFFCFISGLLYCIFIAKFQTELCKLHLESFILFAEGIPIIGGLYAACSEGYAACSEGYGRGKPLPLPSNKPVYMEGIDKNSSDSNNAGSSSSSDNAPAGYSTAGPTSTSNPPRRLIPKAEYDPEHRR